MATTSTPDTGELRLALDDILVGDNVRDIDQEHVGNLAQSISLRGLLAPLIVRPTSAEYELVAGYRRYHACRKPNLSDVPEPAHRLGAALAQGHRAQGIRAGDQKRAAGQSRSVAARAGRGGAVLQAGTDANVIDEGRSRDAAVGLGARAARRQRRGAGSAATRGAAAGVL